MASPATRPEVRAVHSAEAAALPYRWGNFQALLSLVLAALFAFSTVVVVWESQPSPGFRIGFFFFGGAAATWLFFLGWGLLKRYLYGLTLLWTTIWIFLGLSVLLDIDNFSRGYLTDALSLDLGPVLAALFLANCGYIALLFVYYRYYRKRCSIFQQGPALRKLQVGHVLRRLRKKISTYAESHAWSHYDHGFGNNRFKMLTARRKIA